MLHIHIYGSYIFLFIIKYLGIQITFVDGESIIGISGTVGTYEGNNVITTISFLTNKKSYGPYGANEAANFSLPVTRGQYVGFSGNYGDFLECIGVILNSS